MNKEKEKKIYKKREIRYWCDIIQEKGEMKYG